ncbi:hypothetical protein QF042_002556 [Pedobacter sp. W3I1]|nr:hypothetical protein [Pedobacter sp. W3I1]
MVGGSPTKDNLALNKAYKVSRYSVPGLNFVSLEINLSAQSIDVQFRILH